MAEERAERPRESPRVSPALEKISRQIRVELLVVTEPQDFDAT